MKQLSFISFILFIGLSQFGFSQTEWKSETFHGTLKGMSFTATIDYRVDCEHATPFVRATLKDIEVYKYEYEGETYQYGYDLPIRADEGFLVLDGEITLVKGGDFNGTFELNEKHLSSKIGGGGNAMTADEFRFTNESEVTKIMGVNSCSGALEKLEYTTAILEITSVDIAKYDGDLRLNGRAINDLLKEKINKSASSKSNSNNSRSYLEEAKEEKNEYMEQLDREERMEQNRRAESERELNRIKRSNQDPTIKTIEVVEHEMGKVTDSFNASIDRQIAEDRRKQELAIRKEEEEERLEDQKWREREKRVDAYWKHLDERDKLIDPIRNEVYSFAVDYDKADRKFYSAFSNAIRDSKSEIFILPIFQRGKMDFDRETYEIYEEKKYYLKSFTPIKIDLSKYDTIKFASVRAVYDWPKTIKAELEKQGFKRTWYKELVFMYGTDEGTLLENVQSIVRKYDRSILVYEHNKIDVEIIEKRIYEEYLNEIEQVKREKEELRERNEEEARLALEIEQALIVGKINDSIAKRYLKIAPNGEYSEKMNQYIKYTERKDKKFYSVGERTLDQFTKYLTIGNLLKFEEVNFYYMNSKPIPEDLGNLSNLKTIKFKQDGNNFEPFTLPESIKNLHMLETLIVSYNPLKSLPDNLGNFPELKVIEAISCELSSIPESINELKKLEELNLNKNYKITYLPENIVQLSQLKSLRINYNKLKFLPKDIGNLKRLEVIEVSGNNLNDIPQSICDLSQLRVLHLGANKLTQVPENIGKLSNLRELELTQNELDILPNIIGELTQLEKLYLADNNLTSLPDNLLNLKKLKVLDVRNLELDKPSKKILKRLKKLNSGLEIIM